MHSITRRDIPSLTGVRGIAALWVVAFHAYATVFSVLGLPPVETLPPLAGGFMGVDLFFMLSGFILGHVHGDDFRFYSAAEHGRFLKLRLSRIYPLHVVCLAGFLLLVVSLPDFKTPYKNDVFTFQELIATLFLVQNWGIGKVGYWNLPTWSLSAEWLAYLGFPFVLLTIRRVVPHGKEMAVAGLLLAALIGVAILSGAPDLSGTGKIGVLRMAAEFIAGCLIYFSIQNVPRQWSSNLFFWFSLCIIAVCIANKHLYWGAIFGMALLVKSLAQPTRAGDLLFGNPTFVWLGKISFSLYLSHWPLLQFFNWINRHYPSQATHVSPYAIVLVLFVVMFALAVTLWKLVEVPSRDYLRRYIPRRHQFSRADHSHIASPLN